ncbi:hypothetical protein [Flavobacterium sp.]|uniref:hypothetical protein n=1 Tax=Flavobacterium sp. TaxID=239 RepID=UPI0038FC0DC7
MPFTATGTTDDWDTLSQTDLDTNNSNKVLLVYDYNDGRDNATVLQNGNWYLGDE